MYLNEEEMGSLDFFRKIEGYAREHGEGLLSDRSMMEGFTRYIMELDPKTPSEWVAKGRFSRALRNPQKTIRIFEEGLEKYPDSEILMNNYIAELHLQGQWKRAIPYYERMVKKRPDNADVWNIYGSLHLKARKYEKAAKYFKKAVKLDPNYVLPKLNLIRAFDKLGYRKVINDMLEKILQMRIKDQKTLEMVVEICDEIGNPEYEIKILKWMLFLNPERSVLWYGLSDIYHQLRKPLHQLRCLKKVIELDNDPPVVGNALNSLAVIAMEKNDLYKSLKLLLRAVKHNPDNGSSWANLGLALAVKFQLKRGDVAMKISKLVRRRNDLNRPLPFPQQRKNLEVIKLNQQITSLIRKFNSMEFECFACKKTFSNVSRFCPHCGFKLGLSKEDMQKDIDPKKLENLRKNDPLFSRLPRFSPQLILRRLSHRSWTSLSNLYLDLGAETKDEIKEVNRTVQMLEIERKVIRRNANGVVLLKKVADTRNPFF
jgi:tetratricopeptide (TPR) repeat protein